MKFSNYHRLVFANVLLTGLVLAVPSCETLDNNDEKDDTPWNVRFFNTEPVAHEATTETLDQERVKVVNNTLSEESDSSVVATREEPPSSSDAKRPEPFYKSLLDGASANDKIPVFMDWDAVSVYDVVPAFANLLGFNYVIDTRVVGTVTAVIQDPKATDKHMLMTREEMWKLFEQILGVANAYCTIEDGVLHIMPLSMMQKDRLGVGKAVADSNVAVKVFNIRHAQAQTVLAEIADFLSDGAKAVELTGENALMVVDTIANMSKVESIIKMLDTERRSKWPRAVIRCDNVSSKHILTELSGILPVLGFPVVSDRTDTPQGAIYLTQIDRLQVIIASAANKEVLTEVKTWVAMLDRSDVGNQEQVFVYKVVNSKAEDLLQALATIFQVEGTAMSQNVGSVTSGASSLASSVSSVGSATSAGSPRPKSSTKTVNSASATTAKTDDGPASVFEVPVKIFADGTNNRLVFRTTPRTYAMIKALLRRLDTVPAQILLQVLIAEIRLGENTEFGVEFSGVADIGGAKSAFGTNYSNLVPQKPSDNSTGEHGFKYLITRGQDKYMYLRGLAGTGNFKILANPQLAAVSGTAATLDVGQEVPIVTRTLSDSTSSSTLSTSNEIEYKKTGILLKIIPQVTKGGLITLDLNQTVSARGDDVVAGGFSYPSFINRQVVTALSMHDGETLVVGGIIQELDRSQNSSMPFIAKIPILATLLGYSTKDIERTELLIMITASIISEQSELQRLVAKYKQSIALIKKYNKKVEGKKKKDDEAEKK